MKQIVKISIIFFCLWIGTKSLMEITKGIESKTSLIVNFLLFTIFVGSPAATYWGDKMDKFFFEVERNNESNDDENE